MLDTGELHLPDLELKTPANRTRWFSLLYGKRWVLYAMHSPWCGTWIRVQRGGCNRHLICTKVASEPNKGHRDTGAARPKAPPRYESEKRKHQRITSSSNCHLNSPEIDGRHPTILAASSGQASKVASLPSRMLSAILGIRKGNGNRS
jgi:hypothetical protein